MIGKQTNLFSYEFQMLIYHNYIWFWLINSRWLQKKIRKIIQPTIEFKLVIIGFLFFVFLLFLFKLKRWTITHANTSSTCVAQNSFNIFALKVDDYDFCFFFFVKNLFNPFGWTRKCLKREKQLSTKTTNIKEYYRNARDWACFFVFFWLLWNDFELIS